LKYHSFLHETVAKLVDVEELKEDGQFGANIEDIQAAIEAMENIYSPKIMEAFKEARIKEMIEICES